MRKTLIASAIGAAVALSACSKPAEEAKTTAAVEQTQTAAPAAEQGAVSNPLLVKSTLQYEAPEFDKIKVEHYQPAMEEVRAGRLILDGDLITPADGEATVMRRRSPPHSPMWCQVQASAWAICRVMCGMVTAGHRA